MAGLIRPATAEDVAAMIADVSAENPEGCAFHAALGDRLIATLPQGATTSAASWTCG